MSHLNLIDAEPTNRRRRGVQGKCANCGLPIPAAKRLCPACRQQEQEEDQNIHTWKTPTGEAVKRQVATVHVSEKVVFDIFGKAFPIDSPSGPLPRNFDRHLLSAAILHSRHRRCPLRIAD